MGYIKFWPAGSDSNILYTCLKNYKRLDTNIVSEIEWKKLPSGAFFILRGIAGDRQFRHRRLLWASAFGPTARICQIHAYCLGRYKISCRIAELPIGLSWSVRCTWWCYLTQVVIFHHATVTDTWRMSLTHVNGLYPSCKQLPSAATRPLGWRVAPTCRRRAAPNEASIKSWTPSCRN